ncbi:MAG: dihydroorotate dehydrogenase (quinone) [Acidobacteria bacterium]|nr:MAG: dihydroorotate dehydrogenase (quinone) [Acidobacteriota bacterium]
MSLYDSIVRPILFRLPAETAHELALRSLSLTLTNKPVRNLVARRFQSEPFGKLDRFGLEFRNPIGLAAGFDKNGTAAQALSALGFGFIEVGTVTSEPQSGNQRPRIFRLPRDRALVNRLGFNNFGAAQLAENIKRRRPDCVLGVNIGKSRSVPISDAVGDYLKSFDTIYEVADYIAINVSSPNTPNLRDLQRERRPLLLKIAPDLTESQIESIVEVAKSANIAGIIATNTTISRDGLQTPRAEVEASGEGGLSGMPLQNRSNEIIAQIYRLTGGSLPIVGVGGVFTAEDAWEKIGAGASLIQLYTGFIYEGPSVARGINEGLVAILKRSKFRSLNEAIGYRVDRAKR